MNEAVKNVSELLSGSYGKTIIVASKVHVIKAPAIKVIARATQYLSKVDIPENASIAKTMEAVSDHSENIVRGLSYLVVGDVSDYEDKAADVAESLRSGNHAELYSAFLVAFELIIGRDFFVVASSAMELAQLIVKSKS